MTIPKPSSCWRRSWSRKDFASCRAYGGEAGIEIARAEQPDLIILDLLMPEMNGFEVLDHLAQSSVTRRLPVILFTLKQLTAEEQQRIQGRIACLAQKEAFNQQEFVGLVKEALQRTLEGGTDHGGCSHSDRRRQSEESQTDS